MDNLDENWNPMREAYMDASFNSYHQGPGANLEVVPNALNFRSELKQTTYKLYVGNLPVEFSQTGVENLFLPFGQPLQVHVHNAEFGSKKTWGMVTFKSYSEADAAIRDLNGKLPFKLKVEFALSDQKSKVNQEEPEPLLPLNSREANSSYMRQVRGRGRGEIHPFVDPRIGIDYRSYPSDEVGKLNTFQVYGGSPYDYHNRMAMKQPRDGPGLYSHMKVSMGRGAFDRARDTSRHELEELGELDMKDVLTVLENKIILNDPTGFSKREAFEIKQGPCAVCKQTALSMCGQCGTYYCSEKCQTSDWPKHRVVCQMNSGSGNGLGSEKKREPVVSSQLPKRDDLAVDNGEILPVGQKDSGTGAIKKNFNQKYEKKNHLDDFKENKEKPKNDGKANGPKHWKQNEESSSVEQERGFEEHDAGSRKSFKKADEEDRFKNDRRKGPFKNTKQNVSEKIQENGPKVSSGGGRPFGKKPYQDNERNDSNNFHKDGKQFSKKSGSENDFKNGKDQKSPGPKNAVDRKRDSLQAERGHISEVEEEIQASEELPCNVFSKVVTVVSLGELTCYVQRADKQISVLEWSANLQDSKNVQINPDIGVYCAAKFENEWYRAKIISVNPLKVHFVDYGNDESCKESDLKALPEALRVHKAQAIKIRFAAGTPSRFKNLRIDETLEVKCVKKDENGCHIVEIKGVDYSDSSDGDANLGQEQRKQTALPVNIIATLEVNSTGTLMLYEFDTPTFGIGSLVPAGQEAEYRKILSHMQKEFNTFSEVERPVKGEMLAFRSLEVCGRGFVLKAEKELCIAACDTGEIIMDPEVRTLPDKWRNIPWFMVQCTAAEGLTEIPGEQLHFKLVIKTINKTTNECQVNLEGVRDYKATVKPWDPPYELYKELRTCELKEGMCLMTCYRSAKVHYVRPMTQENRNTFNSLLQRVAAECHKSGQLLRPPKVGEIVAALYLDGNFFRARVIAVKDESATVIFIDYGNEEEVKFKDLKPLPEDVRNMKATVIKVVLENVRDRPLTQAACKYLDSLVDGSKPLQLAFSVVKVDTNTVVLSEANSEDTINVKLNKLLVPKWRDGLQDWAKVDFASFPFDKLKKGSTYELFVTHIMGLNAVMCVRKGSKIIQSLRDFLNKEMSEYCNLDKKSYVPCTGELCLAKYDGIWHRASLVKNSPHEGLSLLLLDAGKLATVPHTDIRRIPEEFCNLEAAAVYCIIKFKGDVKEQDQDEIKEYLRDRTLSAEILEEVEEGYVIEILNCPF